MALKKDIGKKVVCASATLLLAASTLLGSAFASARHKESQLADKEQINVVADALDCDLSYMSRNSTGDFVRMMHNGDEPIYVGISDNMNEEENKLIKQSLDYVFDIVGKINNNYYYEIVDDNKLQQMQTLGKTTIYYKEGDCSAVNKDDFHAGGYVQIESNTFSKLYKNEYNTNFYIEYNRDANKDEELDQKLETFLHELLHAFGLKDVYINGPYKTTDLRYENTFMNTHLMLGPIMTPNDLKCLLSVYEEKYTGKELEEYIAKSAQVCSIYSDYYYKNRTEKLQNYYNKPTTQSLEGQDMNSEFQIILNDLIEGVQKTRQYKLQITGNKYVLEMSGYGIDGTAVATGIVQEHNGVKILTNVKVPSHFSFNGMYGQEATIMDLFVFRDEENDLLVDTNYNEAWGKNLEIEKELI